MKLRLRAWTRDIQNAVLELFDNSNIEGKVIDYGKKNTFPNDLLRIIDDSGTATSCIEKRISFINADGFNDEAFSKKKINSKGQTADAVLADLVPYVATFEAGALLIKYDIGGKNPNVEVVPFQYVRKKIGGGFMVNSTLGTKLYKKNQDVHHCEFDPTLTPDQRKKDGDNYIKKGVILYFFKSRPGKEIYPVPTYYSAIEDVESDSGVVKMENSNIKEGYNLNLILKLVGEVDNKTKDDKGKTDQDYLDEDIEKFQGPGGNKVMLLTANTPEGMPQVDAFDSSTILDGIDKAADRIPRRVCRHTSVPPVLVGLTTPEGLGNTQALHNYMILFGSSMLPYQALITEQFEKIFGEGDYSIGTLNLINYVDPLVIELLKDASKSPEQKVYALRILFKYSEEIANRLVYGTDVKPIPPANVS